MHESPMFKKSRKTSWAIVTIGILRQMMFLLDVVGLLEHGCRQVQPLQESSGSPVSKLLAQETSACWKIWPLHAVAQRHIGTGIGSPKNTVSQHEIPKRKLSKHAAKFPAPRSNARRCGLGSHPKSHQVQRSASRMSLRLGFNCLDVPGNNKVRHHKSGHVQPHRGPTCIISCGTW